MNNARTYLFTVLIDKIHIKLLGKQRIPLNRDHRVFLAVNIFRINIHLRTVECSLAHILHKRKIQFRQNIADMSLCFIPDFRFTDVFLRIFRIPFGQMPGNVTQQP